MAEAACSLIVFRGGGEIKMLCWWKPKYLGAFKKFVAIGYTFGSFTKLYHTHLCDRYASDILARLFCALDLASCAWGLLPPLLP